MQIENFRQLDQEPIDPNRARWYALGLTAVGALFAVMTIKSNWDYFDQFFGGFAFAARIITFCGVEAAICFYPLFKGWGNRAQGNVAMLTELLLIPLALAHTFLVSDSIIAKKQATKTKTEASADFDKMQGAADRVTASNLQLQSNHNAQMKRWESAAYVARREGKAAPAPPPAPKLQDVPVVERSVVKDASMSVEAVGEARVSHQTLQGLLFTMVGIVALSFTALVMLADGSRVLQWFKRKRSKELQREMDRNNNGIPDLIEDLYAKDPESVRVNYPQYFAMLAAQDGQNWVPRDIDTGNGNGGRRPKA